MIVNVSKIYGSFVADELANSPRESGSRSRAADGGAPDAQRVTLGEHDVTHQLCIRALQNLLFQVSIVSSTASTIGRYSSTIASMRPCSTQSDVAKNAVVALAAFAKMLNCCDWFAMAGDNVVPAEIEIDFSGLQLPFGVVSGQRLNDQE
jgi:hypothetical protein